MSMQGGYPHPDTLGGALDEGDDASDLIGGEEDGGEELSPEEQIAQLRERLDASDAAREAQQRTFQSTISSLVSGRQQPGDQQEEEDPDLNLDDLPDPVQDLGEFRKQLAKRVRDYSTLTVQNATGRVTAQVGKQASLDRVWSQFREKHPDLAKRDALLRGSALSVAEALRAEGVDPAHLMQHDPDTFISKVATRMQTELGDATGNTNGRTAPAGGRTRGVAGGSRSSTPGRAGGKKPAGFLEQLKKRQSEIGLT